MNRLPEAAYLTVTRGGDCRFTGDLGQLRAVSRAVASIALGEICETPQESTDVTMQIDNVAWEGVLYLGSYLLLQQLEDRTTFMLTRPGNGRDHHCRTIVFAATAESAEDGEGTTELRELLQQATALQLMLAATL